MKRVPSSEEQALQARRDAIGQFIKLRFVDTDHETLFIRFDELSMALLQVKELKFSVTAFENMLRKEVNDKILNRPITPEAFNKLCDYIWELAVYLTTVRVKDEQQTAGIMEERARRKREGRVNR